MNEVKLNLTDAQKEAIEYPCTGRLKIVAGAGSGKTEVLALRIAKFLDKKIKPSSIVAITYTNKAAAEMRERIGKKSRVSRKFVKEIEVNTFHAFLAKLIKNDPFAAQISPDFKILTQFDYELWINKVLDNFLEIFCLKLLSEEEGFLPLVAETVLNQFPLLLTQIRRFLLTPADFLKKVLKHWRINNHQPSKFEKLVALWLYRFFVVYQQSLREHNFLDFDEILFRGKRLIKEYCELNVELPQKVFLVDEFQDNNPEQLEIITMFQRSNDCHLTVVGDPKQSIYRFQGAEVATIENLENAHEKELQENFRSYEEILYFADSFINVKEIKPRFLKSQRGKSPRPKPIACFISDDPSGSSEAVMITKMIKSIIASNMFLPQKKRKITLGDFAIIVSSVKYMPRCLEDELIASDIPYTISGGLGFYDQSEIQEILAFLRLLQNPALDHDLVKILSGPIYGLSDSVLSKIICEARVEGESLLSRLFALPEQSLPTNAVRFRKFFVKWQDEAQRLSLLELVNKLIEEGGFREYAIAQKLYLKRLRLENNYNKFLSIVRNFMIDSVFSSLSDFVSYLDYVLQSGVEDEAAELGLAERDTVKILTIHKAKGLEFPVVFLPFIKKHEYRRKGTIVFSREFGLLTFKDESGNKIQSDILKKYLDADRAAHDAEERRKFYVAATRAEDLLIISGTEKYQNKINSLLNECSLLIYQNENIGMVKQICHWPEALKTWGIDVDTSSSVISSLNSLFQQHKRTAKLDLSVITETAKVLKKFSDERKQKAPAILRLSNFFSLLDLEIFDNCPCKFFLYKLNPHTFNMRGMSSKVQLGTIVHESIKIFHEMNYHDLPTNSRLIKISEILDTVSRLRNCDSASLLKQAASVLNFYAKHELGATKPFGIEIQFHLKIEIENSEKPVYIRGFIDRIDCDTSGFKIYDFKVLSNTTTSAERYHKQIGLYLTAVSKGALGNRDYTNSLQGFIVILGENAIDISPVQPNISEFENWMSETVNKILHEKMWLPKPGEICLDCEYLTLCRPRFNP